MNDNHSTPEATPCRLQTRTAVLICVLATSLPFFMVRFPPSTDLAQHISQIRLAREVLSGRAPELVIAWLAPNNLVYAILGALSAFLSPVVAARIGLWLVTLAWALASLVLAIRRGRDPALGLVVGLLAFQAGLYWGLLNFLVGWPVFVAWLQLTSAPAPPANPWRHYLVLSAVALLLYGAHILWFALAGVWMVLAGVVTRPSHLGWLLRLASMAPGALLAANWYPKLLASRAPFQNGAVWGTLPWQRLHPIRLFETLMGGDAGPWPAATGGVLAFWVLSALITRWGQLRRDSDRVLLLAAALLGALALLGPDKYMNTLFFAQRWAPCALAMLVVGLPAPRLPFCSKIVGALLVTACTATCLAWGLFSELEMTGLEDALTAAPPGARVLELDMVHASQFVGGRPFMQMMAYLQAEKGGSLNFSFAEHGSSLVSYRSPRELTWTPGIEWFPERAGTRDLLEFDVVLMNATPDIHQRFQTHAPVVATTREDVRWRLYTVRRERTKTVDESRGR